MPRYRLVIYVYLCSLPRPWILKPISSDSPRNPNATDPIISAHARHGSPLYSMGVICASRRRGLPSLTCAQSIGARFIHEDRSQDFVDTWSICTGVRGLTWFASLLIQKQSQPWSRHIDNLAGVILLSCCRPASTNGFHGLYI